MKKLFVPLTLIALAGILFSSCSNSSKLAFNKRHYRSGAFVDAIGKNHTTNPPVAVIPIPAKHSISVIPNAESSIAVNTPMAVSHKTDIVQKRNEEKSLTCSSAKQVYSQSLNNTEGPLIQNKQYFSEVSTIQGNSGDEAAGAALSLLWIVIVVILILWLIGIIAGGFGLGGLINLLLVIALILLILWLLRVW